MFEITSLLTKELTIVPAQIEAIDDSGNLHVDIKGNRVDAYILRTSQAPFPELYVHDHVLVALDDVSNVAYVFGVIDRYDRFPGALPPPSRSLSPRDRDDDGNVVRLKGKSIRLEAEKQIEITCGDGKISIDRSGRVIVKGKDVISRAKQTNKLKGGSVAIN